MIDLLFTRANGPPPLSFRRQSAQAPGLPH
jgi:hypothetical protein